MGLGKMRVRQRRQPTRPHVTNWRENPALLAADAAAAEAALRGFAEIETTVRVARAAPLNAAGHSGRFARPARGGRTPPSARSEEAFGLRLGNQRADLLRGDAFGLRAASAPLSTGTTPPWSKAFLASAYASRGIKIRFTSGTGSEALMGYAEQCSMALSGGPLPAHNEGGQAARACRTAPFPASPHAGSAAGRRARGAGGESAGVDAGAGVCLGQRRARLPLGAGARRPN